MDDDDPGVAVVGQSVPSLRGIYEFVEITIEVFGLSII